MAKATIPLYHDDDFERLADLRREVSIAERVLAQERLNAAEDSIGSARAGDAEPDRVREAKEALDAKKAAYGAFVDEASGRAEMWSLKPIGHEEFRKLLKDHPPRKVFEGEGDDRKEVDHPDDEDWEVNTETFPKALLLFVDPEDDEVRTVVEPKFDSEALLRRRVKRLSEGEFQSLWVTAYFANKGGAGDPKSDPSYPATLRSTET